jgi:hypothetical protein
MAGRIPVRKNEWSNKVLALLGAGNAPAAIAQVKVAPSLRDLKALQSALAVAPLAGRWPAVEAAVADNLVLLAAPRLHRSP